MSEPQDITNNPEEKIEDEDEFPEYANEQNKQLNQIIKEKRKLNKEIISKLDERQDRIKILADHLKNVQSELLNTQQLIDSKNKEIETEDHLKQLALRQIGRIETELKKFDKQGIEQQERLNDQQNQIFKSNEKLDQYKLQMNWNQEELEQWALAARQKEEDNLTLEKYKRADESKIKELNLQIERLTVEVSRLQTDLEKEITETQAKQIELDKTAEEFKKQHEQRHQLFEQWQEVTQNIAKRDQAIVDEGENFAQIKLQINANRQVLEDKKIFLNKQKQDNKNLELQIQVNERRISEERAQNKRVEEQITDLEAQVEILKNQLSAFASDLAQKKTYVNGISQDLLNKKQRLTNAQKKFQNQEIKLKNESIAAVGFYEAQKFAEENYKNNEQDKVAIEKDIRIQKDQLFKCTQELFKQREKEADLYGEIQGTMAACRNLQSHIGKLNQEFQRQQELLYNAEYQIQLMERKVAKAKGEKSIEEKRDLEAEIQSLEQNYDTLVKNNKLLISSLKKLDDDLRSIERRLVNSNEEKQKYASLIDQLSLENDMTQQDLTRVTKQKEEVLVRHDCMKLEIQKIKEILDKATDKVFELENRKYQIEMSMQEREKEISVHKDVLVAEKKSAEDERHNIGVELSSRRTKVKNLKIKYESLVAKNQANSGEGVGEHSQAYYIIKASQEREELQRKGDELNAKILKSEKELKALDNTSIHLKNRNSNYRDSFLKKEVTPEDYDYKEALDEQTKAASKNLFQKQKEVDNLVKEFDEDMKRLQELVNKSEMLENQYKDQSHFLEKQAKELKEQSEKKQRAEKTLQTRESNIQKLKLQVNEDSNHMVQLNFDIEYNKNKVLLSAIQSIIVEFPEIQSMVEDSLRVQNIQLPSRPTSSIDIRSQQSQR